jgi:ferredoxin-NADP reductase
VDASVPGGRLAWQEAAVTRIVEQTPTVKSFFLMPEHWTAFVAGQHVDVRLTAPDGYHAERSYSVGSAPGAAEVELVIERLDDGEVSPFFHEVVMPGDAIEIRGPIGGHFFWRREDGGPVLLVGGGSGVVPLMSMVRARAALAPEVPMALIYSARAVDDVVFRDELLGRAEAEPGFALYATVTRETPADARFRAGRIDAGLVGDALAGLGGTPRRTYACGSNAFVDASTRLLLDLGVPFETIRTERYGDEPAAVGAQRTLPEE